MGEGWDKLTISSLHATKSASLRHDAESQLGLLSTTNEKSHVSFRLQSTLMTTNDSERSLRDYFAQYRATRG